MDRTKPRRHSPLLTSVVGAMLVTLLLGGCGGGGDGVQPGVTSTKAGQQGSSASREIYLSVTTAGTVPDGLLIGGMDVVVALPDGVTVKNDAATGLVANGEMSFPDEASAGQSMVVARVLPATNGLPELVHIVLADAHGFPAGEGVTLRCEEPDNVAYRASDFAVNSFSAVDNQSKTLNGITAVVGVASSW